MTPQNAQILPNTTVTFLRHPLLPTLTPDGWLAFLTRSTPFPFGEALIPDASAHLASERSIRERLLRPKAYGLPKGWPGSSLELGVRRGGGRQGALRGR